MGMHVIECWLTSTRQLISTSTTGRRAHLHHRPQHARHLICI